jgi:hypothetical protein
MCNKYSDENKISILITRSRLCSLETIDFLVLGICLMGGRIFIYHIESICYTSRLGAIVTGSLNSTKLLTLLHQTVQVTHRRSYWQRVHELVGRHGSRQHGKFCLCLLPSSARNVSAPALQVSEEILPHQVTDLLF